MDDLFVDIGTASEEALLKSLMAGYGADAALFTGGRALIGEDCEGTMVNAMREQMDDFKLMNTLKKRPMTSNLHQYNVRRGVGDDVVGFVDEGGVAPDNNQDIIKVFKEAKYIQKRGQVTERMRIVNTLEDAYAEEKLATRISVLRTAERFSFHGDSAVVPRQFDGLLAQVRKTPFAKRTIFDIRGQSIATYGDDIQALCKDRPRFGTEYPTLYGALKIAGDEAGPDKLFYPKNKVKPGGIDGQFPNPPASVTASVAAAPNSLFLSSHAGDYAYTVHAVNEAGISLGTPLAAPVSVGADAHITPTITPATLRPGQGFIICRSAKGGTEVMEMARIGANTLDAATTYIDKNEDLPGTAEMLFITEKKIQTVVAFFQLLPPRLYPMNPVDRLVTPFIMALWGTPALKVPQWLRSGRVSSAGGFILSTG